MTAPAEPRHDRLPTPVAELVERAHRGDEPVEARREAMLKVPECLLRVASLPLLAVCLRGPSIHPEMAKLLSLFGFPTFSTWRWLAKVLKRGDLGTDWGPLAGYREDFGRAYRLVNETTAVARPEYALGAAGKEAGLLDLFQGLRNHWAHSSGTSPALCRRDLDEYLPRLDAILDAFAFLGRYRFCSIAGDGHQATLFRGVRPAEIDLADGASEGAALLTPDDRAVPLSPLVVPGPDGALGWFDGYRLGRDGPDASDGLAYQTDLGRQYRSGPVAEGLRALFRAHNVLLLPGSKGLTLRRLNEYLSAVTGQNLKELDARYGRDLFVDRPALTGALRAFVEGERSEEAPVALLLTGPAGSGKSGLLVHLAQGLLRAPGGGPGVLLMRGDKLTVEGDMPQILFSNLLMMLGADREEVRTFADLCERLEASRKGEDRDLRLVVVFDGVNEASDRPEKVFRELLDVIATARPYRWIRIVAAVRSDFLRRHRAGLEGAEKDPLHGLRDLLATPGPDAPEEIRGEGLPVWAVPTITEAERREIYERFRARRAEGTPGVPACLTPWDGLDPEIRGKILDRPLLIRLWMELYDGRPAGALHSVSDLYIAYLDALSASMPGLSRVALPRVVEHMLRVGRSALTDEDAGQIRASGPAGGDALSALVAAGLFEVRVPTTGPVRYGVFHERMAEALAARWLRESVGYPARPDGDRPPPAIDPAALRAWDAFPRHSLNPLLFGGLELFIRRLLDVKDWKNASRVLEHVDFQMPPGSSWLFLAGRQNLTIEFREALRDRLEDRSLRQQNLFQLGLGYIRAGRHEEAADALGLARSLGGSPQMRAAIAMYTGLCLVREGDLDRGEAELEAARGLAAGTRLEGNVHGHLASLRVRRLRASGGDRPPPQDVQEVVEALYRRAIELNGRGTRPDRRCEVFWRKEWGETLLFLGRAGEAVDELEAAWTTCVASGLDAKCRLDLHLALGRSYRFEGRGNEADEQFRLGLALAAEIGDAELRQALEAAKAGGP